MTALTASMHRLLDLIRQHGPISLHVLGREENDNTHVRPLRERVYDLRGLGLARGYKPRVGAVMMVEITDRGLEVLQQPAAPDVNCTIAEQRDRQLRGLYDGRDLQPYTGRPGAMRAFDLPSIHNGRVMPRRPPVIMGCTPALKGQR
jgi:hypothetical protein